MYCPKCKVNRPGDAKYCIVCGTALINTPTSQLPQRKPTSPVVGVLAVLLICVLMALGVCLYFLFSGKMIPEVSPQDLPVAPNEEGEEYDIPTEGTLEYNGHTYYVYGGVVNTWEEARQYCEERGGYLAVINDQAENDVLYEYACGGVHPYAFFGYSDAITEDLWQWVENDQSSYTNWGVNNAGEQQPNSASGTEDYAEFAYKDGTWNDAEFGRDTNRFICEWDTVRTD